MASIRRTISPAYRNGGAVPFSPSHKFFTNGNSTGKDHLGSHLLSLFNRFLGGVFLSKTSRKGGWRRPFYRCLMCFLLGFLLSMAPFGNVENVRSSSSSTDDDFSFDVKQPHVNVRLDDENGDFKTVRPENLAFDTVSLGVEGGVSEERFDLVPRKQLIVVTPTYNRAMQAYYLNRLGQLLRLVQPPLVWIVVEANTASFETAEILRKTGVVYRHLVCKKDLRNIKDRGVHQRNTALEHIELHKLDGILYFADDDNIYSLELLESLRTIRRFGTWPVAMLAQSKSKAILEGPVCNGSQVIGWHTNERSKQLRRFHVDMSGFAFNSTILWDPKRWHRPFSNPIRQLDTVKEGFQETSFIEQVVEDEYEMEGVTSSCSRILNWHLHLDAPNLDYPKGWHLQKNLDAVLPIK